MAPEPIINTERMAHPSPQASGLKGATRAIQQSKNLKRSRKRSTLYCKLDQDRHEIRLLTIHPRKTQPFSAHSERNAISASLTTQSLDDPAEYFALSYVWESGHYFPRSHRKGTRSAGHLLVDSVRIDVNRNLWLAIERIRQDEKTVRIWVDATDLNEKAWQISLMSRIYQQASKTLIWLGKGSPSSRIAMGFLRSLTPKKFLDEVKTLEEYCQKHFAASPQLQPPLIDDWRFCSVWTDKDSPLAKWDHLNSILSLPWWGRRWVIQEAFFSKKPVVILGNESISMDKFAELATWHAQYLSVTRDVQVLVKELFRKCPFYYLLRQWKTYRRDISIHRAPLPVWLTLSRDFNQSILRDFIFGVLSLASARDQLNIQPDYWGSDHMVFVRLFVHLIEIYGFRTFRFTLPSSESLGGLTLPSWCSGDKYGGFQNAVSSSQSVSQKIERFEACGDTSQSIRFIYERTGDEVPFTRPGSPKSTLSSDILMAAKGFQFDEVIIVVPTGLSPKGGIDDIRFNSLEEQLQDAIKSWQRRLRGIQADPYRDTCGRFEAMFMALLGGRLGSITKADCHAQFLQWIEPSASFSTRDGKRSDSLAKGPDRSLFYASIRPRCFNRSLLITAKGYIGLGPLDAEEGDIISILHGVTVPLVLRKQNKAKYHSFVGETYIHGIMHGEGAAEYCREETDFVMI
ncbi:unnamed protein product [Clonostachys byssicola]|uniref:Heterokaryon incompatibility domain-containing protein n=1 Tax=Clonostachys byssicola TaxID=160290 RepID=A0A9N9UTR7_9HYPO|nr:unnamed protein product [Clonostachys byssicola]